MILNLQNLEQRLEEEKGPFKLFGIFLREESPGRWDLLVSSPWIDDNKHRAVRELSQALSRALTRQQVLLISRIVPIGVHHDRFLEALQGMINVQHGLEEVRGEISGVSIDQGYVITCVR